MNNLINVFMEFKIKYFLDCTKFLYSSSHRFVNKCIREYYNTYIDNYYYYTYNTLDSSTTYSEENLSKEFTGIMEEMLDDYKDFELVDSNEVYNSSIESIKRFKDICFEIVKLDHLEYENNDDLKIKVNDFFKNNEVLSKYIKDEKKDIETLIKYTKDYKNTIKKILNYEDNNFSIKRTKYEGCDDKFYVTLDYKYDNIKSINKYRKGYVDNVFKKDDRLNTRKFTCLVNKILFQLLKDTINNEQNYYFISIDDFIFYKDRIINSIYNIMDNPLFRKYVILCCDFHTYLSHKSIFEEDFQFGCKQKFERVNDIYKKTNSIYQEGVFNYLVILNCRDKDREYFQKFKADGMEILLIEED